MKRSFSLCLLFIPLLASAQELDSLTGLKYPAHEIGINALGLFLKSEHYGLFYEWSKERNRSWVGYAAYIKKDIGFSPNRPTTINTIIYPYQFNAYQLHFMIARKWYSPKL